MQFDNTTRWCNNFLDIDTKWGNKIVFMKLKQFLKTNNISAANFSNKIGVPPATLRKWVQGERIPRKKEMLKLMQLTNGEVQPNDFFVEGK